MQKQTLLLALFLMLVVITIPTDAKKKKPTLKKLAKELGFKLEKKIKKLEKDTELGVKLEKTLKKLEKKVQSNTNKIASHTHSEEDSEEEYEEESCPPKPDTMAPFNATRYLGDWYQISGLPAFFQPAGSSCIRATYGETATANNVTVRNVAINPKGNFDEICGHAVQPNAFVGELVVIFPPPAQPGDYLLLDTDYDNFASVWSCATFSIPGMDKELIEKNAWILVRDPANVAPEIMVKAYQAFTNQGLDVSGFMAVSQEGCTYEDPEGAAPCTGGNWNPMG